MTPLQIQMLLHFHCVSGPFTPWGRSQSEARDMFRAEELINDEHQMAGCASLTDRGRAYVQFLCDMPIPVAQWVLPKQEAQ